MIVERIMEAKASKIKQFPVNSNRASELGFECTRYHVLNRTRWNEKKLHDTNLQLNFDMGNMIEKEAIRDMQDARLEIIEQQRSFEWKKYQITGHIDGKILIDGIAYPFDIKSCSPFVFDSINSIEDLKNGKYTYLRKYPSQLNLYLLMDNKEKGLFIFKNKVNGQYKEIWMNLDYCLGEKDLKRAEEINRHIDNGTLPESINDDQICSDCAFQHICLPEINRNEIEIDTSELAELLDRLEQLKEIKSEIHEIENHVKILCNEREKILAGNWVITGKWIEKKGFFVEPSRYWQKKIIKI